MGIPIFSSDVKGFIASIIIIERNLLEGLNKVYNHLELREISLMLLYRKVRHPFNLKEDLSTKKVAGLYNYYAIFLIKINKILIKFEFYSI
jgi:hypothetical protein